MRGPAPKHPSQRARTNATIALRQLPVDGRKGKKPPAWPLKDSARDNGYLQDHDRELELWGKLWTLPQAVAWAEDNSIYEVAMYCHLLARIEAGQSRVMSEWRQLGDRLGMTPMALLRLRWEIVDKAEEKRTGSPAVYTNYDGLVAIGA